MTPNLTLTYGVRYVQLGVPYETNGLQVAPTFPLQEFCAGAARGHGGRHPEQPAAEHA